MKEHNNMNIFNPTLVAALLASATVALSDPNIDMSEIQLNNGTFDMNFTSQSQAGASIVGTKPGTVTASTEAWNVAGGAGGVSFDMEGDTNNAGAGVSGDMDVAGGGLFATFTQGEASATTTGKGDINVAAGTFGSAMIEFDGIFNHTMRTDDWN
jgi:hypothetical protein